MRDMPIDFKSIARQSGKTNGTIFYSATFKSWAVRNGNDPSISLIDAPDGAIAIKNNQWKFEVTRKRGEG